MAFGFEAVTGLVTQLKDPRYVRRFQDVCGVLVRETYNRSENGVKDKGVSHRQIETRKNRNDKCKNNYEKNNNNNNNNNNGVVCDKKITRSDLPCVHPAANSEAAGSNFHLEYEIKYKILYCLAQVGAFLGDEVFYFLFYLFFLWNLDCLITKHTVIVWCIVMYLGQRTKDYLQWPRPPSPPVIHLETCHLREPAMPSTHAMAGTAMPIVLAVKICARYECSCLLVGTLAFLWCALVCLSRLYLGVHTVLDVVCGVLFSVVICAVIVPYLPNIDYYQQHHKLAPLVILIAGIALCTVCYPSTEKHTAKAKAVEIVSVTIGLCCGMSLNYQLGYTTKPAEPLPYPLTLPTAQWVWTSLLRFVCGSLTLVLVYVSVRAVSVRFFSMYFGLDKADARHPSVRLAHKFVTYYCLGLCINSLVPVFVFSALGIERKAALYECY